MEIPTESIKCLIDEFTNENILQSNSVTENVHMLTFSRERLNRLPGLFYKSVLVLFILIFCYFLITNSDCYLLTQSFYSNVTSDCFSPNAILCSNKHVHVSSQY